MRARLFCSTVAIVGALVAPLVPTSAHAGTPTAAAVVAAAPGCPTFAALGRDLLWSFEPPADDTCQAAVSFPDAFPVPPRTITTVDMDATAGYRSSSLWATYGDALHRLVLRTSWETGTDVYTVTDTPSGSGWQGIRLLVASEWNGYLYGIHDNGRLYRYTARAGVVRSAGSQPGFGGVRTLTLIGEYADRDVLLVTLATGQLSVVRVPRTTTLSATSSQIRSRSWQGFEAVVFNDAGPTTAPNTLVALNATTHRWHTYSMADATRGLATAMSTVGSVAAGQVIAPAATPTTSFPLSGG